MKGIAITLLNGRRDYFWLERNFGMWRSSNRGAGFSTAGGGTFTSPLAGVATMSRKPGVLDPGLSPVEDGGPVILGSSEHSEVGSSDANAGTSGSDSLGLSSGRLGGGGGAVGGVLAREHRLDVFGLGTNYAMFTKSFWAADDDHDFSPWYNLGGKFTSAPAAVAWSNDRIDIVGLGMDHALYRKSRRGQRWTQQWERIGGTYTSAPCFVRRGPNRMDLYIREADYTLRRLQTDGTSWETEQNLGGYLASAPVAVSWGPDRVDIFAVFRDGALWHRWWDGELWNEWESLGGRYMGEPEAVSWGQGRLDVFAIDAEAKGLRHHWYSAGTWYEPEPLPGGPFSVSAVSGEPNRLELFCPRLDGNLRRLTWDGSVWNDGAAGPRVRIPGQYRFSVDYVKAVVPRALNNDTVAVGMSLAAGNCATRRKAQFSGKLGNTAPDTAQTNLLEIEPVEVDLAEPVSLSYLVVNNGHADQDKILAALQSAGDSLSLASVSSTSEDIAKKVVEFVAVKITDAISVPVIGSVVDELESWLMGKLTDALFEACDGIVATELFVLMGRDLVEKTVKGTKPMRVVTKHLGTDSPGNCGSRSEYEVTWSIKPL